MKKPSIRFCLNSSYLQPQWPKLNVKGPDLRRNILFLISVTETSCTFFGPDKGPLYQTEILRSRQSSDTVMPPTLAMIDVTPAQNWQIFQHFYVYLKRSDKTWCYVPVNLQHFNEHRFWLELYKYFSVHFTGHSHNSLRGHNCYK